MITKFHGIDRHNKYSTISVLNRKGEEIDFKQKCSDFKGYIDRLGPKDAVIIKASTGVFYWADRIESQGAVCYVIDPHKFRIIKDSWNKTDKHDSRNMVKGRLKTIHIEHRLFSEISKNWAGQPLTSYETAVNYISTTRTESGLTVDARLVSMVYEKDESVSDAQMATILLVKNENLRDWNYTIQPSRMRIYF